MIYNNKRNGASTIGVYNNFSHDYLHVHSHWNVGGPITSTVIFYRVLFVLYICWGEMLNML